MKKQSWSLLEITFQDTGPSSENLTNFKDLFIALSELIINSFCFVVL